MTSPISIALFLNSLIRPLNIIESKILTIASDCVQLIFFLIIYWVWSFFQEYRYIPLDTHGFFFPHQAYDYVLGEICNLCY